MANTVNSKTIPQLPSNPVAAADYLVFEHDPAGISTTSKITQANYLAGLSSPMTISANITMSGAAYLSGNNLAMANVTITYRATPTGNADTVNSGRFWFDNNYIYVAVSNNSIKRVALTTF